MSELPMETWHNAGIQMERKAVFNLSSPNRLLGACDLKDIDSWFESELGAVDSKPVKDILKTVAGNIDKFVSWPQKAILLWRGCDRIPPPGKKQKYFAYPEAIKNLVNRRFALDTRMNGPAITSFLLADGARPARFGSSNAWSIHHLYSGKYPYHGKDAGLHAVKSGLHFTQSAGLVATHPIADALSDEFPFFAWRLRAEAFIRFGYDPDNIFGKRHDELGFANGMKCQVIHDGG